MATKKIKRLALELKPGDVVISEITTGRDPFVVEWVATEAGHTHIAGRYADTGRPRTVRIYYRLVLTVAVKSDAKPLKWVKHPAWDKNYFVQVTPDVVFEIDPCWSRIYEGRVDGYDIVEHRNAVLVTPFFEEEISELDIERVDETQPVTASRIDHVRYFNEAKIEAAEHAKDLVDVAATR